ncbi:MAG: DUF899 family protein [Acidimicrobiales bacterium]
MVTRPRRAGTCRPTQAKIDQLRVKEKAHTRAGDALAAERRRLPMVEVDPQTLLPQSISADRLLPDVGRSALGRRPRRWRWPSEGTATGAVTADGRRACRRPMRRSAPGSCRPGGHGGCCR